MRLSHTVVDVQLAFLALFFFGSALVSANVSLTGVEIEYLKKLVNGMAMDNHDYPEKWEDFADEFYVVVSAKLPFGRRHEQPFRTPFELAKFSASKEICSVSQKTLDGLQLKDHLYQVKAVFLKEKAEADALKVQAEAATLVAGSTPSADANPRRPPTPTGFEILARLVLDGSHDINSPDKPV